MLSEAKLKIKMEKNDFIVIKKENPYWRAFYANGYGISMNDYLILHAVEALYLIESKKAIVFDKNRKEIDFEYICKMIGKENEFIWQLYLVYKDVRDRGYNIRVNVKQDLTPFEIYERGKNPLQHDSFAILFIAESGKELPLNRLSEALEIAKRHQKKLVVALIDELGDLTYYQVDETLTEETILKIYRRK